MATHRVRLTDSRLALAFAALGFPEYPATNLSVEPLTEFKKLVDANCAEKLTAFQKARDAWAVQYNATLLKEQALAVAQAKLDAAEARAMRHIFTWALLSEDEHVAQFDSINRQIEKMVPMLTKLRTTQNAAKDAAASARSATARLREAFDATFAEMMDARRAEELARALPTVWAGDQRVAAWFERQVVIVRAYSPMLEAAL